MKKLKILTVVEYYLPAYRAGGPIRSISNIVEALGEEFDFDVLTGDRDLGESAPFAGLQVGGWEPVGKAKVHYLSPEEKRLGSWKDLLNSLQFDLIYLNSFFSSFTIMTLLLHKTGQIPDKPIVLACRGELGSGALSIKRFRKEAYLLLSRAAGFYNDVVWQASSPYERAELMCLAKPAPAKVFVAPDLPGPAKNGRYELCGKKAGCLRVIFLSRIARKKNLLMALQLLSCMKGKIQFDIYGPLEDRAYWQQCERAMENLPAGVEASYKGTVAPDKVQELFSGYHLFLFPTLNENFGYVILEALCGGCLVLTSDTTAWRGLAVEQVGWDLPLSDHEAFLRALQEMVDLEGPEFERRSQRARRFGHAFTNNPALKEATRNMFRAALNGIR